MLVAVLRLSGQALPAAEASHISTGFSLPTRSGSLSYGLTGSESLNWGFFSNTHLSTSSNISGNLAVISASKRSPFSASLAAGHSFGVSGQQSFNFLSMGLSQVLAVGRWYYVVADNLSYLPQTPTSGYAGIPGIGDLNVGTISIGVIPTSIIAQPTQGVLTNYSTQLSNSTSGTVERDFTAKTGMHGSVAYSTTRFIGSAGNNPQAQGLDSNGISGGGGINHMYNPRNVIGGNYTYNVYSFVNYKPGVVEPDFKTQTASLNYMHQFSRRLSMTTSAGPQWISTQEIDRTTSLSLYANLSAAYKSEHVSSSLSFTRSANGGYGVIGGAVSDSLSYSGSRNLGRYWAGSASASYAHSTSLPSKLLPAYGFNTGSVSGQMSRALPRSLSVFVSYSLQEQSNHGSVLVLLDAFSGHYQTLGFGLTYAPRPIYFGSH